MTQSVDTPEGGEAESEQSTEPSLTLDRDDLFHLLQNGRRRAALRYLFEHDDDTPVVMRDLAEAVAAREHDTSVGQLDSDQRQRIYIALYQSHLPKLDDHDVIDYDQDRGAIELQPLASLFRPYLEESFDDACTELVRPDDATTEERGVLAKLCSLFD